MAQFSELKRKHPFPLLFLGFRLKKKPLWCLSANPLLVLQHCPVALGFLAGATMPRFVLVP